MERIRLGGCHAARTSGADQRRPCSHGLASDPIFHLESFRGVLPICPLRPSDISAHHQAEHLTNRVTGRNYLSSPCQTTSFVAVVFIFRASGDTTTENRSQRDNVKGHQESRNPRGIEVERISRKQENAQDRNKPIPSTM